MVRQRYRCLLPHLVRRKGSGTSMLWMYRIGGAVIVLLLDYLRRWTRRGGVKHEQPNGDHYRQLIL